tara:strand:+ start:500 stop:931 length:432 start_codon:yes stop_codon:yes gene_type:complete
MLDELNIIPFLETVVERHTRTKLSRTERYVRTSLTHRLIVDVLLLRHFKKEPPIYVTDLIRLVKKSDETVRKAVDQGVYDGLIEVSPNGDRRAKPLKASDRLVERFVKSYVQKQEGALTSKASENKRKETTNEHPSEWKEVPS